MPIEPTELWVCGSITFTPCSPIIGSLPDSRDEKRSFEIYRGSQRDVLINWPGKLLKDLLEQEVLVLQTTPYGENPTKAIFAVSELRNVLGELAPTCGWRLELA